MDSDTEKMQKKVDDLKWCLERRQKVIDNKEGASKLAAIDDLMAENAAKLIEQWGQVTKQVPFEQDVPF